MSDMPIYIWYARRVCESVNLYATYKHAYLYEFSRASNVLLAYFVQNLGGKSFFALNPLNNARGA